MKKISLVTDAYPKINGEDYIAKVEYIFYDRSGKVPELPEEPDFQITSITISKDAHGPQEEIKLDGDDFYNMVEDAEIIYCVEEDIQEYIDEMYSRYEDSIEASYVE